MAVTAIPLTTGSSTANATSYTTDSITPTPGRLVLVAVYATVASGSTTVDLSGCGLTWVKVDQTGATARSIHLFRGRGPTTTAGPLTITGSVSMTSALWQVTEFNGTDTSGADGSGAVVQSVNSRPGSATLVNVPLPSDVTAGNAVFGAVGVAVQEAPAVGGAPWTSLGTTTQSAPTSGLLGEFAAEALQNITASWTTSASSFVVGAEIKAATGVVTPTGAAVGSWSFSGDAVGSANYSGTASGTWGFTGAAQGGNAPVGTAAGSWSFTGAAVGVSDRTGTATGSWGFTGSAVGSRVNAGTASGTWGFTGSAVGSTPVVFGMGHTYGYATLASSGIVTAVLVTVHPGVSTLTATTVGGFGLTFGSSFGETTVTSSANGVSDAVLTYSPGIATLQTD